MVLLIQLRARRNRVAHDHEIELLLAVLLVDRAHEHAARFDSHHLSRRKVHDSHKRLADELFRLVECVNSGENRAVCARAVIQCELKELLGLLDRNAIFDFYDPEIGLAESLEIDGLLKERLCLGVLRSDYLRSFRSLWSGLFGSLFSRCVRCTFAAPERPPSELPEPLERPLRPPFHQVRQMHLCRLRSSLSGRAGRP